MSEGVRQGRVRLDLQDEKEAATADGQVEQRPVLLHPQALQEVQAQEEPPVAEKLKRSNTEGRY
jgi:hypothetical protein